jgi:MarR family transcriptional repressor of emrRAB
VRPRWLIEEEGPRPPLEPRAAQLLGALAVAVSDRLVASLSESARLSPAAVAALLWIHRAPGVRSRELRKALGIGSAAVAQLVSRLERLGLILRTRDPLDGRAERLRVSELGARSADQALRAKAHRLGSLVASLPEVLRPRLIRIAELLLPALSDTPRDLFRTCRFCDWNLCRMDATAPCPLVLASASRGETTPAPESDTNRIREERQIVEGQDPPIELWLEPGAIAFRLDARRRLEVVCRGPERGRLELERQPEGHLVLYAWNDATFTVLEAGREIFVAERPLSLGMVPGETPRQRVESLLGPFSRRRETPPSRWL